MLCHKKHVMPDHALFCPACAEEQSRLAYREYQVHPLRLVAQGMATLTTCRIGAVRHIKQFGAARTFCNLSTDGAQRKTRIDAKQFVAETAGLCPKCTDEVAGILAEVE